MIVWYGNIACDFVKSKVVASICDRYRILESEIYFSVMKCLDKLAFFSRLNGDSKIIKHIIDKSRLCTSDI